MKTKGRIRRRNRRGHRFTWRKGWESKVPHKIQLKLYASRSRFLDRVLIEVFGRESMLTLMDLNDAFKAIQEEPWPEEMGEPQSGFQFGIQPGQGDYKVLYRHRRQQCPDIAQQQTENGSIPDGTGSK